MLQVDVDVVSMLLPSAHCSFVHVPATAHGENLAKLRKKKEGSCSHAPHEYEDSAHHHVGTFSNLGGIHPLVCV